MSAPFHQVRRLSSTPQVEMNYCKHAKWQSTSPSISNVLADYEESADIEVLEIKGPPLGSSNFSLHEAISYITILF